MNDLDLPKNSFSKAHNDQPIDVPTCFFYAFILINECYLCKYLSFYPQIKSLSTHTIVGVDTKIDKYDSFD